MKAEKAIGFSLTRATGSVSAATRVLFAAQLLAFGVFRRHLPYAFSNLLRDKNRFASAALTSSRCRFFAKPR